MKAIRCILGSHEMAERHRETIETSQWTHKCGDESNDYERRTQVVIKECAREGCTHQIAYRCTVNHGYTKVERGDEHIEPLHPERARELLFTEKI